MRGMMYCNAVKVFTGMEWNGGTLSVAYMFKMEYKAKMLCLIEYPDCEYFEGRYKIKENILEKEFTLLLEFRRVKISPFCMETSLAVFSW